MSTAHEHHDPQTANDPGAAMEQPANNDPTPPANSAAPFADPAPSESANTAANERRAVTPEQIPHPRTPGEDTTPGAELAPIDGEVVSAGESAELDRRLARQAAARAAGWVRRVPPQQAARVVRVARESEKPARAGWSSLRHSLTVLQGLESWGKRAWDASTLGVYRRQIKAAEAAGDRDALVDWTERKEQAQERRHKRLMDLPKLAFGLAKIAMGSLAGLVALVLVIGVFVQLSGEGAFTDVVVGFFHAVLWVFSAVAFAWTPFIMGLPFALTLTAWREGMRRRQPPQWLARRMGNDTATGGVIVTADGIVRALQHLGIGGLNTAFKNEWLPKFVTSPVRDGNGYRAVFELPLGVTPDMLADKRAVLARNLHRAEVEVWPADSGKAEGGVAGHVDLWVADAGVLSQPAPQYPLLHEGTGDVFAGVPVGVSQRGDLVSYPLVESNFVFGGMMGQGKSNGCRVVMLGAALDPLAELWAHVFAGNGDFDAYQPRLARYHRGAGDDVVLAGLDSLTELYEEVGRRETRLAQLGAKKVTRALAEQHPDLRPIISVYSECHELFGHKEHGEAAAEYAVQTLRRGRKTGITLGFDTQSSRKEAIPPKIVELVRLNGCFAVKTWRTNDGFLGDGSFAAGVRATELRPGKDRGTCLVTGLGDEPFEIVKTFYIEADDDTGYDAATDVIARAMTSVNPAVATGTDDPGETEPAERDLLADLDAVLGHEPTRIAHVPALLAQHAPHWPPYQQLTGTELRDRLTADYGITVPSTGNRYPLDPNTVRSELAKRQTTDNETDTDT